MFTHHTFQNEEEALRTAEQIAKHSDFNLTVCEGYTEDDEGNFTTFQGYRIWNHQEDEPEFVTMIKPQHPAIGNPFHPDFKASEFVRNCRWTAVHFLAV